MPKKYVTRDEVPEGWLSRAKLAKASGVTRATVKHYNDLGLLPPPLFTSPNMAYYDPASIDRIRLVRDLQAKRHLPLTVIAEILEVEGPERVEKALQFSQALQADLLDTLAGPRNKPVKQKDLLKIKGVTVDVLERLEQLGLVRRLPDDNGAAPQYDALSFKVVQAVGAMRGIGLSEDAGFRVDDLALYRDKLQELINAEARMFTKRVLGRLNMKSAENLMRNGLEGADALVLAIRARLLADFLGAQANSPHSSRQ